MIGGILKDLADSDPPLSLHAQALAECGISTDKAMSDRDLAIALLRALSDGDNQTRAPRWAQLCSKIPHGSSVRTSLLSVAGIDYDEVTGWDQIGQCPLCGAEHEGDSEEDEEEEEQPSGPVHLGG